MMRITIYTLLVLICGTTLPNFQARAQDNALAELATDLVKVENDQFVIDKYMRCQISLPLNLGGGVPFNRFGMQVRFSAPSSGLISRDRFVALSMRIFTEAQIRMAADIPGLTNEQTLQAMQCTEVAKGADPRKEFLLDVNLVREGVVSTIVDNRVGTKTVTKEPWRSVLRSLPYKN